MNNGSKTKSGLRLATNCFTYIEIEYLCLILKEKFNLNTSIYTSGPKKGFIIYIKLDSKYTFINITKPYMHNSMLYKFGNIISLKAKNN
jgi:hypothetical protein